MSPLHRSWLADQADAIKYQREMRELDTYANPNPASQRRHLQGHRGRSMSALHRQWLQDQAEAAQYRRQMAELDAYANPAPENVEAAKKLQQTLRAARLVRDLDNMSKKAA